MPKTASYCHCGDCAATAAADTARLPWLHIADNLPRKSGSARDSLTAAADAVEKP